MSVNLIWSFTAGGNAIDSYVDHGDVNNGSNSAGREIYVRHDGENEISNVGFFVREFTGTYNGDATSNADIVELLGWGDANTAASFGGIMVSWDSVAGYVADWPAYDDKDPGSAIVHRTGTGDSEQNAVSLPAGSIVGGAADAGKIDSGDNPGVRFKMRVYVPTDEDTVGIRLFDHVCKYNYTS
jgi:hypothetical protein